MGTRIGKYLIVLICFFAACTHKTQDVTLTVLGASVKISKRLPPGFCRELGEVYASHKGPGNQLERILENARNILRNKAARQGANYVMIESTNTTVHANQTVMVLAASTYVCRFSQEKLKANKKAPPKKPRPEDLEPKEQIDTDDAVLEALEKELEE